MRLIDGANLLVDICLDSCGKVPDEPCKSCYIGQKVASMPAIDAVPGFLYERIRWERDVAKQQLEDHGICFGCTAPDVVKVVRCKDCKYMETYGDFNGRYCHTWGFFNGAGDDGFCNYGERKGGEADE